MPTLWTFLDVVQLFFDGDALQVPSVVQRTGTLIGHASGGLCGPQLSGWAPCLALTQDWQFFFNVRGEKEKPWKWPDKRSVQEHKQRDSVEEENVASRSMQCEAGAARGGNRTGSVQDQTTPCELRVGRTLR